MFFVLSNFTRSSIAPTLFGRKTENCFTSGPSIFEVVCGKSTAIWVARRREKSAPRIDNYLIADLSLANPIYWRYRAHVIRWANPADSFKGYTVTSDARFNMAKPNSSFRLFIFRRHR